jgi:exodeoxyribonuclease VII large subunit
VRVLKERRGEKFHVVAARLAASLRANVDAHRARIGRGRERTEALGERARRATQNLIERRGAMLERSAQLLNALSYHGVLARGFALVRDPEGRPVRQAALVAAGMRLDIEFSDGHVGAVAEAPGAVPAPSPPKPRARRDTSDPGQGSLFGS